MANTLTGLIPVIYAGMDIVARELVGMIPAVSIDAKAEMAAVGQSITTPITPIATTGDITPGQLPPDDGDQNIGSLTMTITKSKYSPIRWTGEELRGFLNPTAGAVSEQAKQVLAKQFAQSVRALCNLVEADLVAAAVQGASRAYGTAGTTPFGTNADLSDLAQIRKILEDNGAPCADLQLVLNTAAAASLRGKQAGLFRVNEAGTESMLRDGVLGNLEGFRTGISGMLKQVTKGTGASYVTSGVTAAGANAVALVTGTGTVNAGDIVTFAADSVNKYVVNQGVSAPGTIYLGSPGALASIATANALTVGNSYTPNMAFEREALKLLARTPAMPEGGDMATDVMEYTDPVSGLTFQIAMYKTYRRVKYEIGLAWGVKSIKPDFVATLLG